MKRNLMLLTAVVLVAVMLSGCALWPFGKTVKITVELPKNEAGDALLEVTNLADKGKYDKEAAFKLKFKTTDAYTTDEYTDEDFAVEAVAKKGDKVDVPKVLSADGEGYKLEGKTGKKALTIKITAAE